MSIQDGQSRSWIHEINDDGLELLVERDPQKGMTVSLHGMEISAASLAAIVRNADTTTLIVDCRCLAEFKQSHICRATNPFYSKLLQRRLLEDKV
ncbi:hypothetical protein Y032_0117g662 [Ancylostoma ceylanicum]|nr:hypothetical protein Y032_0117g662 [Ancylostoma ceylanicum]